jgi:hypothetical protein
VPIRIAKTGDRFSADVTPPHGSGSPWETPAPLFPSDLIAALRAQGCHQTDIADALYEADPLWDQALED